MEATDERLMTILGTLGPRTPEEWRNADEIGRVAMTFAISKAVRGKLGDAAADDAFRILFAFATAGEN